MMLLVLSVSDQEGDDDRDGEEGKGKKCIVGKGRRRAYTHRRKREDWVNYSSLKLFSHYECGGPASL